MLVMTDPTASITDLETKFSDGMSSSPCRGEWETRRSSVAAPRAGGMHACRADPMLPPGAHLPLAVLLVLDDVVQLGVNLLQRGVQHLGPLRGVRGGEDGPGGRRAVPGTAPAKSPREAANRRCGAGSAVSVAVVSPDTTVARPPPRTPTQREISQTPRRQRVRTSPRTHAPWPWSTGGPLPCDHSRPGC